MGFRDFVNNLGLGQIVSEMTTPRSMPADLQANGIQGTAVVTGMRATPVGFGASFNADHVVVFDLLVSVPDREPYPLTTNQTVPNMLQGTILPGATVFVRVDPANLGRVAIDFSQIIPNFGAGTPTASGPIGAGAPGMAVPSATPGAQPMSGDQLRATGTAATGVAQQTFSVGNITAPNGDPVLGLIMSITYPGGAPYISKNGQRIPRDKYSLIVPGATLPLKGNPAVPDLWTIDWPALHEPS